MKLLLVHRDEPLGDAWRSSFGSCSGVDVESGDICTIRCDAVVSPANSFGFMDGGLDRALSERFGWHVQERLQEKIRKRPLGELLVGEALVVSTGDKHVPWLVSAPTMRVPMRLRQSVNAYLAMKALLLAALAHQREPGIETIAVPGLGTGVGALPPDVAALQMHAAYREVVLGERTFPEDFGAAQSAHRQMNVDQINLWDP